MMGQFGRIEANDYQRIREEALAKRRRELEAAEQSDTTEAVQADGKAEEQSEAAEVEAVEVEAAEVE